MLCTAVMRRTRLDLDPDSKETATREMEGKERLSYYFGENVGLLVFRPWYPCIAAKGHQANMHSYDFPVRLKFVDQPFDALPFHESSDSNRGWNLSEWQQRAVELQEEGVRAIVCGCGLTGSIQPMLQSVVDIPVYSSSMLFVPELVASLPAGKRLGILTVGESFLRAHNNALFRECGIDESAMPLAVAGMYESDQVDKWSTMASDDFDPAVVEDALVTVAKKLVAEHPDIGMLLFECTDMPPYADAVRQATGLPVFDPVDMVKRVNAKFA
jgi:Asp/Glu/hydantoin racemase